MIVFTFMERREPSAIYKKLAISFDENLLK
jgi:hypothetical protein